MKQEEIPYHPYSLWDDILDWQQIYESTESKARDSFWSICKKTVQWPEFSNGDVKEIITFFYFKERYPRSADEFNVKISKSGENSKILFFLLHNRTDNTLGSILTSHREKIETLHKDTIIDPFYQAFYSELQRGRLILEERKLFKIYRDEKSFDLSYLDHLLFNPEMPIDFNYAYVHYYNLKAPISNVLRNLDSEGKKKPFLLTFYNEHGKGGIAEAINLLKNEEKFPELNQKYSLIGYGNNARLGLLEGKIDSLERLEDEMEKDLRITMPCMKSNEKIETNFNAFLKIGRVIKPGFNPKIIIGLFEKYKQLTIEKDTIKLKINSLYQFFDKGATGAIKDDLSIKHALLQDEIKKYPPLFQILLHELEYSHEKIKIFGESQKLDPFEEIRTDLTRSIHNKELLVTSIEFEEKSEKEYSIKEINEKVIDSLNLYALVSKQIAEIKDNSEFQKYLNENILSFLFKKKYPECKTLTEFCSRMANELIPNPNELRLLDTFNTKAPEIIRSHSAYILSLHDILQEYINTNKDTKLKTLLVPELLPKISSAVVNSCLCIALILFKEINEAIQFLNQTEVKRIKEEVLKNLNIDFVQEKRLIIILNALFALHETNLIRPIFKNDEVVTEAIFHDKVYQYLYNLFREDIIDESKVAAGWLDIEVLKIPVELKIDKDLQKIDEIYTQHKDQFDEYCYRHRSRIGILYVYEYGTKIAGYPKDDIKLFTCEENFCIVIILRGNLPAPSKIGSMGHATLESPKKVKRRENPNT